MPPLGAGFGALALWQPVAPSPRLPLRWTVAGDLSRAQQPPIREAERGVLRFGSVDRAVCDAVQELRPHPLETTVKVKPRPAVTETKSGREHKEVGVAVPRDQPLVDEVVDRPAEPYRDIRR